MANCQCENREHFEGGPNVHGFEGVKATKKVDTLYGRFNSCNKCASTHLKTFPTNDESKSFFKGEATF